MKSKVFFLTTGFLFILLAILACGPVNTPTPTNPPVGPATSTTVTPTPTDTPTPTQAAPIITDTPTDTEQPPLPTTGPGAPQSASPAHFSHGSVITLTQIKMVSATNGWGLIGPYVVVTSDGGRTWKEVMPPQTFTDPTKAKTSAQFLDDQHAWVLFSENDQIPPEAVIWSTSDRGQTWTPSAPLLHQVNAEYLWGEFANNGPQTGWLLLRGEYLGAGTHYVAQLFQTTDGGLIWSDLQPSLDLGYDFTSLVFVNAQIGWLAWQTTGFYGPGAPAYATTSDGGANWNSLELPAPADEPSLFTDYDYAEPYQVNLLSPTSIRLLVGAFTYGQPPKKFVSYLYSTEDGGATWTTKVLPAKVLATNYTLIFFDSNTGLLLGKDTYSTADGGNTWQHVSTVFWDGQYSFVDAQNGWAIATIGTQSSLVCTKNGGKTWNGLKPVIAP